VFIYGKTAANAIAIMSCLASRPGERFGSGEIAKTRNISKPLTAKLLTQLSAAGLISGQPGPGGGYTLARSADAIRLADVIRLFEQANEPDVCPFGHGWCGNGDPCPLHDTIIDMLASNRRFLDDTRLSVFMT